MAEIILTINLVIDNKNTEVSVSNFSAAEDVCITLCKQLGIGPVARHLFALRISNVKKPTFLMPSATFGDKNPPYDLRIRFKPANINRLKEVDRKAYDYYFHQARNDVLENKIPDLYEKYKRELVGLGVTDMYRIMLEKDMPREIVESEYRKYIPKEVLKRHPIFIKKPIHDALGKIQKKVGHDAWYVKMEYLKQLQIMAPEYLTEEYKAITDHNGSVYSIYVKVSPDGHTSGTGIRMCYESKRDEWKDICSIEELCYISVRKDGTVEISRKNGIPFYLKFGSLPSMLSFVSLLDGYYRLTCKWIFNLCKDVPTPSLQKLYSMKCHGPVGGEFSYAKLEEKRANRPGCFVVRESESKYNVYYIDICVKDSMKPKTFKLERLTGDEFIFNDDTRKYKTVRQLMAAYNDPQGQIYLQECLPPSEYDISPLLLCQSNNLSGDSLTDSSEVHGIIPNTALCINSKDIQVYKDLSLCKVSHLGLEYRGQVAKTEGGVRCQSWQTDSPVHKVDPSFTDNKFSDHSKKAAKNYCRNPNRDPKGPWCYTIHPQLIDDTCAIPICTSTECKRTGPGIEYGGQHNHAMSGKKCLKWNKDRNKVKEKGGYIKIKKFDKYKFPENDVAAAKKFCRNPDGDVAGPWCFVEDGNEIKREYCDIPFCDDRDSIIFSKDQARYTHYINFDYKLNNITFGLKVWDSDSYATANARLVLTIVALPFKAKEIEDADIGIEIYISNTFSALTSGSKINKLEEEPSVNILESTEFTFFSLSWGGGFVTLTEEGKSKPIFLAEYKTKGNLLGFLKDKFYFYAIQGKNMLWSFPFYNEDKCDVYTTISTSYQYFLPLRETKTGRDLQIHVRAFHSAYIMLVPSPVLQYPYIEIAFSGSDNFTRILCREYENGPKVTLKELVLSKLLNYWKWKEFSISFFADTLQIYQIKEIGTHMIIEIKHDVVRKIRWFASSSINNLAHWTFYCKPPKYAEPPNEWPPECALNKEEPDYKGTQGVTASGLPCVPWSSHTVLPKQDSSLFSGNDALNTMNFCRDPKQELQGTYCYAASIQPSFKIEKTYCHIRKCKSSECKMAGTANDYVGSLNVTRSNRTCQSWTSYIQSRINLINSTSYANSTNITNGITSTNSIDSTSASELWFKDYLNGTLYPDMSADAAQNFCRNPSRSIAGTWCFTADSGIYDICNVRDCDKLEECIIIVKKQGEGRNVYILPQWKERGMHGGLHFALKGWDPDLTEGIIFEIKPLKGQESIKLVIGANNNEKILLYYKNELVKEKTFPHLILSGKWTSFWLQMRKGELLLGYEGVPDALFEWKHDEPSKAFEPVFIAYMSIYDNPIGVFFKCDECHLEVTSANHFNKIMPIGLWSELESEMYSNFTITMRGVGKILIPLMTIPERNDYYAIHLQNLNVAFVRHSSKDVEILHSQNFTKLLFTNTTWTSFIITFSQNYLNIFINGSELLKYNNSSPLLFYWFSVAVEEGIVTWTVNCDPPDIDGNPINGGWSHWSSWQCSVSCGGGEGFRTRTCSNPRPNIFGNLCEGTSISTGQKKEGQEGLTVVYRSMWRLTKGKKTEVAMKVLKHDCCEKYLKDFLELTGHWAFLQSNAIVRLYGITMTSPISMVLEYMRLGPLDQYLKSNKTILKEVDLIEASSNLAAALWHLKENDIVHGNIRCRKLMVSCHEENTFTVKLADPGIHHTYASKEVHWIPVECYSNLEYAKHSTAADVWAFATTLWEIFMFGECIKHTDHLEAMRFYSSGKRLPQPPKCPNDIYQLMRKCWDADPHQRKQPQAIMRDVNQILYQVYNSRRVPAYAKVLTKSLNGAQGMASASSTNSLFSVATESTAVAYSDELVSVADMSEADGDLSFSTGFGKVGHLEHNWLFGSQDIGNSEDAMSNDFSSVFSNFNFSMATSATSLDSISSLQSIFELDADCNVILQGRIGQGFYGEVYKGALEFLGDKDCEPRLVAVKKLKRSAVSTCLQDFEREISIMKTLKHPNIVEILGVLQEPEVSLVMEFVQHGSLQSYLKIYRESLSIKQLLKYASDIAKGMHYLGTKHIVHRDLAARNILVVDENHVKISDFGLAQVMGASEYYILKTNRELPIKWYAPESLRDGKFSPRSDVWSYGVTMCEMFGHGEEPQLRVPSMERGEGQEQQVLLNAIESGARFPCPPMCPQSVYVRIIIPCWQADPHERPRFDQLCEETEDLLLQY